MRPVVYLKGKQVDPTVLLEVQALTREVGVFETFRVYKGKFFRLEQHLERLRESANTVGITTLTSPEELTSDLKLAVQDFYARGDLRAKPPLSVRLTCLGSKPYVMILERAHPAQLYDRGVRLKTSPVKRSHPNAVYPEVKTSAYQNSLLACLEPRTPETYEFLFLNADGYLNEVTIGNIFLLKKKAAKLRLLTPPTVGILNGVTRKFVIECALQAGIECAEIPLSRHDLYNADEAFLTNSSWEILPVSEVDSRKIGSGKPGPETLKLGKIIQAQIQRECL